MADYSALRHPDAAQHVSLGMREHTISNLSRDADASTSAQLCVRTVEAFDADSCPGYCLCEEEIDCGRPCCTVRRPLRCAGLVYLVVALGEALGLFAVSAVVAYQNWPRGARSSLSSSPTSATPAPSPSASAPGALLNEASVDSIMSMYGCFCFAVFSVGAVRSESRVELGASVGFSWLVVAFCALHMTGADAAAYGPFWQNVKFAVLVGVSACSLLVTGLALPVASTFGWVSYKTLRNADVTSQAVYRRYCHWIDASEIDFSLWVLTVLSAGAFQVAEGLDLVLASAALGASALWAVLGRTAARRHWAGVFTWVYMPLSLVLPVYGGFSAWKFWGKDREGVGIGAGGPIDPVKFAVLVGLALACRAVLMWAAWKMRASAEFSHTPGVLRQIGEVRRQARPSVAFADMIVDERGNGGR